MRDRDPLLAAAGAMAAATLASRVLGLVREQVFAFLFGAGDLTDAFQVAFRIPSLLRNLFAEGAMSASLVPTFTQVRSHEGERRAWQVAGRVFGLLVLGVGLLTAVGMLAAGPLVGLYAAGFRSVPGKLELTVRLTRVMLPYFPLVALSAAFMGILNACGRFFVPAFSSAFFNLASVLSGVALVFLFARLPGQPFPPILGMALGVLLGGAVQVLSQWPALREAGFRWQPAAAGDPPWQRDPALGRMLGLMAPGVVGLAAVQVSVLINTLLATGEGPGAVSCLGYAFRFLQFPLGLFGASLATAALPLVSRQWVQGDLPGVQETLSRALRHVFAINLPASAGLICLGSPIIATVFQYGHFTAEATSRTALALAMYSLGLTAYSVIKLLVPACYALGRTRIPVVASVLTVLVTLTLNLLWVRAWGFWSLALGTSVGALVNAAFLTLSIRKILREAGGEFRLGPLTVSFLQQLGISMAMGVVCYASFRGLDALWPDPAGARGVTLALLRCVKLGGVMVEGVVLIVLLGWLLQLPDSSEIHDIFGQKLKKKLRAGPK